MKLGVESTFKILLRIVTENFFLVVVVVNIYGYFCVAVLGFDRIPLWGTFIISFGSGIIAAIIIRLFIVPWQRNRIKS